MKPYLFLSGLLLGSSISMSSLMADTHVVNASCNDARYGACTSAQTSLTTDDNMPSTRSIPSLMADTRVLDASCNDARFGACTSSTRSNHDLEDFCDFNLDEALYQGILGFSPAHSRSMLEEVLAFPVDIVVASAIGFALPFVFPIVIAGAVYCGMR